MLRSLGEEAKLILLAAVISASTACAPPRAAQVGAAPIAGSLDARQPAMSDASEPPAGLCAGCTTLPMTTAITRAIVTRVAELKARGGDCATYGAVLDGALTLGQITLRPFMWRVGQHLASGEGKPSGEMVLAREIDSLNVGVRTMDDLVESVEHEAAHIAFAIRSDFGERVVEERVRSCRPR